jgi:hypothetical protein
MNDRPRLNALVSTITLSVLVAWGCAQQSKPLQLDEAAIQKAKAAMQERGQEPVSANDPAMSNESDAPTDIQALGRGGRGTPPAP